MISKGRSIQSVAEVTIYPFLNDSLHSDDDAVISEILDYINIFADIGVERKHFLGLQNVLYHKNSNIARKSLHILRKMPPYVGMKDVEIDTDVWKSMYPFLCNQALSTSVVAIESLRILDALVDYGIVGDYRNLQKVLLHKNNYVAHLALAILRKIVGLCIEPGTEDVKIREKLMQNLPGKDNEDDKVNVKYVAIKKLKSDYKGKKEVLEGVTSQIQKIKDIDAKINALDNELKEFPGYEKVSNDIIIDLRHLENQRNELQDDLDRIRPDNYEQDAPNIVKPENQLLYIGIVIFLIGVFGALLINSLFIVGILIGTILIIIHAIISKTNSIIEKLESAAPEKKILIENLSRQIESYYSSLPANNLKELSQKFEIYSEKIQKKADLESQRDTMMGKNHAGELEKRKHELSTEIGKIDTELQELGEQNPSAEK